MRQYNDLLDASNTNTVTKENLTPAETASYLCINKGTLANWRSQGKGPHYIRMGEKRGPIIYRKSDIDAWLEQNKI